MRVIYIDTDGRKGTFHPHLGWLESGKEFVMYDDDEAKRYIKSGLLTKVQSPKMKTKKNAFTLLREEKEEVEDNDKSTDR
ncbi:MAG: hypothetical protein JRD89_12640 [Deltaproteobacteria bacterium]|nr:hypothetical protein [Deltaproteobacteria bacterium]MBW2674240.1 hypothetical protein [Deltaproteobacteria bacterium]